MTTLFLQGKVEAALAAGQVAVRLNRQDPDILAERLGRGRELVECDDDRLSPSGPVEGGLGPPSRLQRQANALPRPAARLN